MLAAINGGDPADRSSIDMPFRFDPEDGIDGMRVGYLPTAFEDDAATEVDHAALAAIRELGVDVVELTLPELPYESLMAVLFDEAAAAFEELTLTDRDDELVWQEPNPPDEVAEFFREGYPAMTDRVGIERAVCEAGYGLVGGFTLPDAAWWDDYYTPLEAKLPSLKQKYAGDEEALGVVAMTESEIDMRRRYGRSYGYQFFVCRKSA